MSVESSLSSWRREDFFPSPGGGVTWEGGSESGPGSPPRVNLPPPDPRSGGGHVCPSRPVPSRSSMFRPVGPVTSIICVCPPCPVRSRRAPSPPSCPVPSGPSNPVAPSGLPRPAPSGLPRPVCPVPGPSRPSRPIRSGPSNFRQQSRKRVDALHPNISTHRYMSAFLYDCAMPAFSLPSSLPRL